MKENKYHKSYGFVNGKISVVVAGLQFIVAAFETVDSTRRRSQSNQLRKYDGACKTR